ncbi:hypothetical protein GCM10020229_56240 [Kitasatospora albolonga]
MSEPEFVSAPALILRSLTGEPDRVVLTTADGVGITAGEYVAATHRLAHELIARGAGRGTTVSLLTGNTPEALSARHAAGVAGARVVNLYDGMSAEVLAEIVTSVDTAVLLVDAERYADAPELLALVDVPTVLSLGPAPKAEGEAIGEDVIAAAAGRPDGPRRWRSARTTTWASGTPAAPPASPRASSACTAPTAGPSTSRSAPPTGAARASWPPPRSPTSPVCSAI